MNQLFRASVSGPLKPLASDFTRELLRQGYTKGSALHQIHLVAHLSRWLMEEGLDVGDLCLEKTVQFLKVRRSLGYSELLSVQALKPFLNHLRNLKIIPDEIPTQSHEPMELLLDRFRHYLEFERGLVHKNTCRYIHEVRTFLNTRISSNGHDLELSNLNAHDVTTFVVTLCKRQTKRSTKKAVTALRSFLRFLFVNGAIKQQLALAVPSICMRQLVGIPKYMEPKQVNKMLAACDRRTRTGCRDFAIMKLLARLGLRAGEIAALKLDDIDWRSGEIILNGKSNRLDRLPLPQDVGEALAVYLHRGRPVGTESRQIFLRVIAPHGALRSDGVRKVVISAARRAGLGRVGAHRLRHTLATQMLRAGASLPEVGQVLRHSRILTTAIYAKVDLKALRTIAPAWVGGVA
jgi:integrase/recombinase XerD